jgi:hypothetical protein
MPNRPRWQGSCRFPATDGERALDPRSVNHDDSGRRSTAIVVNVVDSGADATRGRAAMVGVTTGCDASDDRRAVRLTTTAFAYADGELSSTGGRTRALLRST